ncbi:putative transmembrane repetitive protein [uncultured Stenotrophomonas sp.]|uniref:Putative transmembrane repetitive protein n=1 Tax=uncultured Stenotrophomonas sp. TaxID=165438 RepID=A0A1Y5Q1Z6_9GAMM|nr:putative transmembrane repetitive protein [uncultured Stenotrophomonas sp.]
MPVPSVAELIDLLAARVQAVRLHDRRTGMPYSWSGWLRGWVSRAESAFAPDEMIGVMAGRTLLLERRPPVRAFWQVMLLLLWHGGEPPPRDQRGLRWFAAFCSVALHLVFAMLLVWVALVRSNAPDERADEGERVQVEYIGRGTVQEEGGGAPVAIGAQAPAAARDGQSAGGRPAPVQPEAVPLAEAVVPVEQAVAARAQPAVMVPVPVDAPGQESAPEQLLQATETLRPTTDFVVSPRLLTPALHAPEPRVRERRIETAVERPQPTQGVRSPVIAPPQMDAPQVQVRERQVEMVPQQQVTLAALVPSDAQVRLRMPEPGVRERQIEMAASREVEMAPVRPRETEVRLQGPDVAVHERQMPGVQEAPAVASPAAGEEAAATADQGRAAAATPAAGAAESSIATAPVPATHPGTSPGGGPKPQDRSGGWATPARSDDWGASQRQVAGNAGGQADQGLFNADGSVRLADDGKERGQDATRGAPGGDSDGWSRERIAQAGTWLKRPPYDYTPTSFDKYWVPNESLLAEWVRKGIKNIEIPIPGTKTKISCVVSMLQFGGGCGLTNPDMQEQPAGARPPPDIPFKEELQEDNGSR